MSAIVWDATGAVGTTPDGFTAEICRGAFTNRPLVKITPPGQQTIFQRPDENTDARTMAEKAITEHRSKMAPSNLRESRAVA